MTERERQILERAKADPAFLDSLAASLGIIPKQTPPALDLPRDSAFAESTEASAYQPTRVEAVQKPEDQLNVFLDAALRTVRGGTVRPPEDFGMGEALLRSYGQGATGLPLAAPTEQQYPLTSKIGGTLGFVSAMPAATGALSKIALKTTTPLITKEIAKQTAKSSAAQQIAKEAAKRAAAGAGAFGAFEAMQSGVRGLVGAEQGDWGDIAKRIAEQSAFGAAIGGTGAFTGGLARKMKTPAGRVGTQLAAEGTALAGVAEGFRRMHGEEGSASDIAFEFALPTALRVPQMLGVASKTIGEMRSERAGQTQKPPPEKAEFTVEGEPSTPNRAYESILSALRKGKEHSKAALERIKQRRKATEEALKDVDPATRGKAVADATREQIAEELANENLANEVSESISASGGKNGKEIVSSITERNVATPGVYQGRGGKRYVVTAETNAEAGTAELRIVDQKGAGVAKIKTTPDQINAKWREIASSERLRKISELDKNLNTDELADNVVSSMAFPESVREYARAVAKSFSTASQEKIDVVDSNGDPIPNKIAQPLKRAIRRVTLDRLGAKQESVPSKEVEVGESEHKRNSLDSIRETMMESELESVSSYRNDSGSIDKLISRLNKGRDKAEHVSRDEVLAEIDKVIQEKRDASEDASMVYTREMIDAEASGGVTRELGDGIVAVKRKGKKDWTVFQQDKAITDEITLPDGTKIEQGGEMKPRALGEVLVRARGKKPVKPEAPEAKPDKAVKPEVPDTPEIKADEAVGEKQMLIGKYSGALAKDFASISNDLKNPQTNVETMAVFNDLRSRGMTDEYIRKAIGDKKFNFLNEISFLNPEGKFMLALGSDVVMDNKHRLSAAAKFAGRMRKEFPDKFTKANEDEFYDWMTEGGRIRNADMRRVESLIRKRIAEEGFGDNSPSGSGSAIGFHTKSAELDWGGKRGLSKKELIDMASEAARHRDEAITDVEKAERQKEIDALQERINKTPDNQADLFGVGIPWPHLSRFFRAIGRQVGILPYGGKAQKPSMGTASRMVDDIVERVRQSRSAKPTGDSVKDALESMTEHDRIIRDGEFLEHYLKKVFEDAVPDKAEQLNIIHAYENKFAKKYVDQLSKEGRQALLWLNKEMKKIRKYVLDNEVLEPIDEKNINYITHWWKNPKTGEAYEFDYGRMSKAIPQQRQRKIPTYAEGIADGLVPATTNPGELAGKIWANVLRVDQTRKTIADLSSIQVAGGAHIKRTTNSKGKPIALVETWSTLDSQGMTEGYVKYYHPALKKNMVIVQSDGTKLIVKGDIGVHESVYPFVRAYMESPTYSKFEQLNFAVKTIQLGLSFFHGMMLGVQEMTNLRVPFVNIPRGLKYRKLLTPEMRLLHREGLELFKGYEDLGYQDKFFSDSWRPKGVPVGKVGNIAAKPLYVTRKIIFDYIQPGMKASFAHDMYHKLLPKYLEQAQNKKSQFYGETREKTEERLARDVVEKADGHFSGEHYKRATLESTEWMAKMYFSPTARRMWQAILLSPTWQREHFLVVKNIAKSFMTDSAIKKLGMKEMGAIKGQYRKYFYVALLTIMAVDMWNYQTTEREDGEGRHLWENPKGKGFAMRLPYDDPPTEYPVKDSDKLRKIYSTLALSQINGNDKEFKHALLLLDKEGKTLDKKYLSLVRSAIEKGDDIPEMTRTVPGGPAYVRPLKSTFEVAEWFSDPVKKSGNKVSPLISVIFDQITAPEYKYPDSWGSMPDRALDIVGDVIIPMSFGGPYDVYKGKKNVLSGSIGIVGFPTSKMRPEDTREMYYTRMANALEEKDMEKFRELKKEFKALGFEYQPTKVRRAKRLLTLEEQ